MDNKLKTLIISMFVMLCVFALWAKLRGTNEPEYDTNICAAPPFRTVEEHAKAQEDGYEVHPSYRCITKESMAAMEREREARKLAPAAKAEEERLSSLKAQLADERVQSLTTARRGNKTEISATSDSPIPLPQPPAELFVRADYQNLQGITLPAFVSPDPRDGEKHAAIIWLTGGDSNSLDDFWTPGAEGNDQTASAFRKAGVIMMFPTLRGGNNQQSGKEYFYGEVDDVISAAEHLATLRYVDADQIYLGGHSTGGTLALLTTESSNRFAATFAFGAVAEVTQYPNSIFPLKYREHGDYELRLRSPRHWIQDIGTPTYLIEGRRPPSNVGDLQTLCDVPSLHVYCIAVPNQDHFSVLGSVTRILAARIAVPSGKGPLLKQEEFE